MVEMIHAELYRMSRRSYTYISLACCVLTPLAMLVLLVYLKGISYIPEQINLFLLMTVLPSLFISGLYLTVLGADNAFSEAHRNGILKNEVSFGLSRWKSYLSRWVASLLFCMALLAVLVLTLLLVGLVLLGPPSDTSSLAQFGMTTGEMGAHLLQLLGISLLYALPLWLGSMSLMLALLFLFSSSTMASMTFLAALIGLPPLLDQLGTYLWPICSTLYRFTLSAPFEILARGITPGSGDMAHAWLVGLLWTVGATALGLYTHQRRQIK